MQHLVIDHVGDEVFWDVRLIETPVDVNALVALIVRAEHHAPPWHRALISHPGDRKIELSLKIVRV